MKGGCNVYSDCFVCVVLDHCLRPFRRSTEVLTLTRESRHGMVVHESRLRADNTGE